MALNKTEVELIAKDLASAIFAKLDKNATRSMGGVTGSMQKMTPHAINAAKFIAKIGAAAVVTAAAVALLATKVGKDFEFSLASVGAVAGATTEQMRGLETTAREIGSSTSFSAKEASDAMYNLASAGLEVTDVMGSAKDAVILAESTAADMSTSTHLMASSMRTFGLDATNSTKISDLFAQTVRKSMFTLSGLSDAMKFAGPVGAALGMTLGDTTAAVALFKNLGLEASQAGTGFRMSMINLVNPTDQVHEALARAGVTLAEVNPEMVGFDGVVKRMAQSSMTTADAFQIFGTRAGAAMAAIIQQHKTGQTDVDNFYTTINTNTGVSAEMQERMMNTVQGRWKQFTSAISELLLTLFDSYKGQVKSALETGATFINNLKLVFEQIAPIVTMLTEYFLTFVQVMGESFGGFTESFSMTKEQTGSIALTIMDTFQTLGETILIVFEGATWIVLQFVKAVGFMAGQNTEKIDVMINNIGSFREKFVEASQAAQAAALVVMNAKKIEEGQHTESTGKMMANLDKFTLANVTAGQKVVEETKKNSEKVISAKTKESVRIFNDKKAAQDKLIAEIAAGNAKAATQEVAFRNAMFSNLQDTLNKSIEAGMSWADTTRNIMKNLTDVLIDQLVKLAAQAAATQLAMSFAGPGGALAGGFAGVGISAVGSLLKGVFKFQEGGIVTQPTLGMVGEAGPEAIIPLHRAGDMGSKTVIINNHIHVTGVVGDDMSMSKLARVMKPYTDRVADL
jgi:TP901 family phage tail tape measure protein